jgi:hypothetical protein
MASYISSKNVFICYAREDTKAAKRLYTDLKKAGLNPWLDKENIRGVQNWRNAIKDGINRNRFFIPLLSSVSTIKKGYLQKELRNALDVVDEYLPDAIFIIPVKLDECNIPYEKLRDLHCIDMFSVR